MSDPSNDNPQSDPGLAPPTVELVETQPGSVHVVLSLPTEAEASAGPPPPEQTDEASRVAGAVASGVAKAVGKVLSGVWDAVKPKDE